MARLRHIAVVVSHLDKAAEFYANVFEFRHLQARLAGYRRV